jgi:hypothetical protein
MGRGEEGTWRDEEDQNTLPVYIEDNIMKPTKHCLERVEEDGGNGI